MSNIPHSPSETPVSTGYRVDPHRGQRIGRVSSEWFSRPEDERYLSLSALHDAVYARAERTTTRTLESHTIKVEANREDAQRLALVLPNRDAPLVPTPLELRSALQPGGRPILLPACPSRTLGGHQPAARAAVASRRTGQNIGVGERGIELRAATNPEYGRIWDHELVAAVQKIAGNGTGDTRWKVPGILDWSTLTYNPFVDVTTETTTLYASDRDVFLFLVDDTNPIEAGCSAMRSTTSSARPIRRTACAEPNPPGAQCVRASIS
jgi:hypothetical protein